MTFLDAFSLLLFLSLAESRRVSVAIQNAARCEVKSFSCLLSKREEEVFVRAIFNLGFCTKKVPKTHA